jgi:HEAT repeat protein
MEDLKNLPSYLKIARIFEFMNDGSDESLEIVMDFAKNDSCPLVRHEAVFALGEMAAPSVREFLKELVRKDESYVVRHEALIALGTIGKEEDKEFLKRYFDDPILEVSNSAKVGYERLSMIESLEGKVKENLDYYISRLKSEDVLQNEKIQILFQLMLEGSEKAIYAIYSTIVNDTSSVVRHEAGFVLGEIGNLKSVELMGKALETEDSPIVIHETLFGLGTSGKKEALPIIEEFLNHGDYVVSESAKIAKERLMNLKNPYSGARHFSE